MNFSAVRRFIREVQTIRARKKHLAKMVEKHNWGLDPGLYRLEFQLALRMGSPVPEALRRSKRFRLSRHDYPLVARVVRILELCLPPIIVKVSASEGGEAGDGFRASQLLVSEGGDVRLFDVEKARVLTRHIGGAESERRRSAEVERGNLSKILPVVPALVREDGGEVIEPLIDGRRFTDLALEEKKDVWRNLALSLATNLSEHEWPVLGKELAVRWTQEAEARLTAPIAGVIADHRAEILNVLATSPVIPTHGDLYGNNVLIGEYGGVCVIDLDTYCELPFFFDIISLPWAEAVEGEYELLYFVLLEEIQTPLRTLMRASGVCMGSTEPHTCPQYVIVALAYLVILVAVDPLLDAKQERTPKQIERVTRPMRWLLSQKG